jgi:hypothetical protein
MVSKILGGDLDPTEPCYPISFTSASLTARVRSVTALANYATRLTGDNLKRFSKFHSPTNATSITHLKLLVIFPGVAGRVGIDSTLLALMTHEEQCTMLFIQPPFS